MESIVNNKFLGRSILTLFALVEHVQVMSYGNRMISNSNGDWTTTMSTIFDGMEKVALRVTGNAFMWLYVLAMVFSLLGIIVYSVFMVQIHMWNKARWSIWAGVILLVDNVLFGLFFIPMVGTLLEVQYCNDDGHLLNFTNIDCWNRSQITMMLFGFFGVSAATFMAAVVFPILKSERKGLEMRWVDEGYFPGLFKLLDVGIINVFAASHHPYLGIVACAVLMTYLGVFQCYRDNHIAAVKMGILFAQMWVFICAQTGQNNSVNGSYMLIGWPPALLVGYLLMWVLWPLREWSTPRLSLENSLK